MDNSYTPVETEFRAFIGKFCGTRRFSVEQMASLRDVFFAGAASVVGLVQISEGSIFDELIDYADHREEA